MVPEVEWFESNFPGTSYTSLVIKSEGVQLSLGPFRRVPPQIRTFQIKMALVVLDLLKNQDNFSCGYAASLLDYPSQGTRDHRVDYQSKTIC